MSEPRPYDLDDPKEKERLLNELSRYLADDKVAGRNAFLNDGTDLSGRKYAIEALDEHRKRYIAKLKKQSE